LKNQIKESRMSQGENSLLPLLVGAGLLMLHFILYSFNSYGSITNREIYYLLYGEYNDYYVANKEVILVSLGSFVLIIGISFFLKGLRRLNQSRKNEKETGFLIFNVIFVVVIFSTMFVAILDTIGFSYVTLIGPNPVFSSLSYITAMIFANLVLFAIMIILVGIQSYLLRKRELYPYAKIKRQIVPYIMWCSLLAWFIFFLIFIIIENGYANIVVFSGFASSQLSTSLLAAGIYLELVVKIDNSIQAIRISE